jgi:hypothetical protein
MYTQFAAHKPLHFIIAGTEKAGTTSIFTYLSSHPDICGSSVKETDFFRNQFTGNIEKDLENYNRYFSRCYNEKSIRMEASPGYLGSAKEVTERIHKILPGIKFLFILRNPVDRLYSSYNFHVGKLNISQDISFYDYINKCMLFDAGKASPDELGLSEWYLKVLSYGNYSTYLKYFFDTFQEHQIKVMFYEDMNNNINDFMKDLCQYLDISYAPFVNYEFKKANVTFSGKNKLLHRIAVIANNMLEPALRQRPDLKYKIVDYYKKLNQDKEGYSCMSDKCHILLTNYYQSSIDSLAHLIPDQNIPWDLS